MLTKSRTGTNYLKIILTACIALVWLINGLFCKLLNLVPRHQMIVSRILGEEYAWLATKFIGVLEILMVAWIISGIRSRWCTLTQVFVIALMNIIEVILARDLLLFGWVNTVVAAFFMGVIFLNEFIIIDTRPKEVERAS